MTLEIEVVSLLKDFGFPVVAFLLMYRMSNGAIKENTAAINQLRETLIRQESSRV